MGKSKIKTQHSVSYAQMAELLSKAADTDKLIIEKLKTKVANDDSYKALRQISWMAGAPEWDSETTYKAGWRVRCQGWVFKALNDTTECPFTVISSETGLPIVNENYQLLITEKINTENWAQIEEAYFLSNYDLTVQLKAAQETITAQATEIADLASRLKTVEDFLNKSTFIIQG